MRDWDGYEHDLRRDIDIFYTEDDDGALVDSWEYEPRAPQGSYEELRARYWADLKWWLYTQCDARAFQEAA